MIANNDCSPFTGANAANWKIIQTYRNGIVNSRLIAAAAAAEGVTDKGELKALARLADAQQLSGVLKSKAAKAFYKGWLGGKAYRAAALGKAVSKKIIAPIFILMAAKHCTQAYAEDGAHGLLEALGDELVFRQELEFVAGEVLTPVGKVYDNAFDNGRDRAKMKSLHGIPLDSLPGPDQTAIRRERLKNPSVNGQQYLNGPPDGAGGDPLEGVPDE